MYLHLHAYLIAIYFKLPTVENTQLFNGLVTFLTKFCFVIWIPFGQNLIDAIFPAITSEQFVGSIENSIKYVMT